MTLAPRPSLTASHTLFSAHNDWDMDGEPSGPLDVKIVEGRVRVNARIIRDADMTIQSVSVRRGRSQKIATATSSFA